VLAGVAEGAEVRGAAVPPGAALAARLFGSGMTTAVLESEG
jgi:hypothetical protein